MHQPNRNLPTIVLNEAMFAMDEEVQNDDMFADGPRGQHGYLLQSFYNFMQKMKSLPGSIDHKFGE